MHISIGTCMLLLHSLPIIPTDSPKDPLLGGYK